MKTIADQPKPVLVLVSLLIGGIVGAAIGASFQDVSTGKNYNQTLTFHSTLMQANLGDLRGALNREGGIESVADNVSRLANLWERVEPPKEKRGVHREYTKAVKMVNEAVRKYSTGLSQRDTDKMKDARDILMRVNDQIRTAAVALEQSR